MTAPTISPPRRRRRRRPEEARRIILEAAESLLVEGDVHTVTVRAVADRAGMTDMGVNHHFDSVHGLHQALLEHVAERLRREIARLADQWLRQGARLAELVELLAESYEAGHAKLALALHEAGWKDRGKPLLGPVVEALHTARVRCIGRHAELEESRLAVAALHQALALDPLFGAEFRRSVGISGRKAADPLPQRAWWVRTLAGQLGLPPG